MYDIGGKANDKYVKEQGAFLIRKIKEMIDENPKIVDKKEKDIVYVITLYTFLFILHKKASILAICTIIYKVTTTPKHSLMGENCVISGTTHIVFQSERYTK